MAKILLLHGPNLNMLGKREPEIYGSKTLAEINTQLCQMADSLKHELTIYQSNAEHELISWIQNAPANHYAFIIINPGAYTHTSIAIRDALLSVALPFIEVHLSNIFARESFRHQSYLSDIAQGIIMGFGEMSYHYALNAANHFLRSLVHGHA